MRIFVAGGAGAIGRELVPQLLDAGHDVIGTTRDPRRAEWLRANGAEAALLDVYDREAVLRAGLLYGPGTGREGPSPGDAASVHVADAARAAALALDAPLGIYNIVDDGGSVSNARARRTLGWAPASRFQMQ